jgi:hypothetical protein
VGHTYYDNSCSHTSPDIGAVCSNFTLLTPFTQVASTASRMAAPAPAPPPSANPAPVAVVNIPVPPVPFTPGGFAFLHNSRWSQGMPETPQQPRFWVARILSVVQAQPGSAAAAAAGGGAGGAAGVKVKVQWHVETAPGSRLYKQTPKTFFEPARSLRPLPDMAWDNVASAWKLSGPFNEMGSFAVEGQQQQQQPTPAPKASPAAPGAPATPATTKPALPAAAAAPAPLPRDPDAAPVRIKVREFMCSCDLSSCASASL